MTTPNQLPMASLHIRPAVPTDIPFVLAQIPRLAAFGPPAWRNPTQMTHVDTVELTRALQQPAPEESVWIAETTRPVGLLHLLVNTDYYQQTHAYISNLIVTEAAEGQGVGRALLAHAEAWAWAEGYTTLSLSVFAQSTAARALYQKAGFGEDIIRYLLLREKGFNYSQIAEKLNALRFVTRHGKPFRAEQVKRLYLRALA